MFQVNNSKVAYVPMPEGSKELLTNTSFEQKEGIGARNWTCIGGEWEGNEYVSLTDIDPYEGKSAIRINSRIRNNPWTKQVVRGTFRKGEVYQMSAWVRKENDGGFGFKLEWFDDEEKIIRGNNSDFFTENTGKKWVQVVQHMTIPVDCNIIYFYVRMFSTDIADVDSVSFYKIKDPDKVTIETDEIFYYTEEAQKGGLGKAEAFVNAAYYPELTDQSVTFRLRSEDSVIVESKGHAVSNGYATWQFPISLMRYEWKEYILEVAAVDNNGKETAVTSRPIYKYPRPTMLNEEGRIILDNGEIFNPVLYYHVEVERYAQVKAIGATAVQACDETLSGVWECLEEAKRHGLKVMVPLYKDMIPAGHESNVANTIEIIENIKDHPALLGYMVMDEPSSYWGQKLYVFEDSYKLIRMLDAKHPVYMVEASPVWFDTFNKYVDILGIDPYLQIDKKYQVEHVRDYAEQATAATQYQKPVWCINQLEKLGSYMPDENGIRNMFYQGLMGGAVTIGYFPFYGCYYDEAGNRVDLPDTPNYEILKKFYSSNEVNEAYSHFVDHKYPVFAIKKEKTYWMSSYVKDNAVYMVVVNNSMTPTECNIPLTGGDDAVSIGDFRAEMVYGGKGTVIGNGMLSFCLEGDGAYVWKIIPSDILDLKTALTKH